MNRYLLWFCSHMYIDPSLGWTFLKYYGDAKAVYDRDEDAFVNDFPSHETKIRRMCSDRKTYDYDAEKERLERLDIRFVGYDDEEYPSRLENIASKPFGLYVRGDLPDEKPFSVGMVGARNCSAYGENISLWFSKELAEKGIQIISGMAAGIDGFCHRGALLAGGRTFAVTGCGVDICYPESNRDIYMEMIQKGGVISECPPGTKPLPFLFPQRNRIISGLSDAVLIVEARKKSGSLITADLALDQGRDVFAVPGAIGEPLSAGCNNLIRQGAGTATDPETLLEDLGFLREIDEEKQTSVKISLERPKNPVYSCLSLRAATVDEICEKTGLDAPDVLKELYKLELEGRAKEVSKNRYTLVR